MTPSPFYKPKLKPECEHLRLISQRIHDPENPKRSQVDTYLYCSLLERKIRKHDCTECSYYKPLSITKT